VIEGGEKLPDTGVPDDDDASQNENQIFSHEFLQPAVMVSKSSSK